MRFIWSEVKRKLNGQTHGLDFVDAPRVFDGPTFTFEDDRFDYSEQRFVTFGLLDGLVVSIVHTESRGKFASSLSARRRNMNKRSISKTSKTDWPRVRAMADRDIVLSAEHPEASVKHIIRGIVRRGLKPVPPKASISLRVDADVLEWLKARVQAIKPASTPSCVHSRKRRPKPAFNRTWRYGVSTWRAAVAPRGLACFVRPRLSYAPSQEHTCPREGQRTSPPAIG